jgi:hypothetical protein
MNTAYRSDGTFAIKITLSAPSADFVTVQWTTEDGSATASEDYVAASDTAIFKPGSTEQTIQVTLINNGETQGEYFLIVLSNPQNATFVGSPFISAELFLEVRPSPPPTVPLSVPLAITVVHNPFPNPVRPGKYSEVWLTAAATTPPSLPSGIYAQWDPWSVTRIEHSNEPAGPWRDQSLSSFAPFFIPDPSAGPPVAGTDANSVVLSVKFPSIGYWKVTVGASVKYASSSIDYASGSASQVLPLIYVAQKGVDIAKVEWVDVKMQDGKDNYFPNAPEMKKIGGVGDVLYAEQNNPTGWKDGKKLLDELHDRIVIKVTLTKAPPKGVDVTVYIQTFDPICYNPKISKTAPPGLGKPGSGDNVQVRLELDGSQRVFSSSATALYDAGFTEDLSAIAIADGEGIAKAQVVLKGDGDKKEVTVIMFIGEEGLQPGNNFIAAATTDPKYFNDVAFDEKDNKTLKYKVTTAVPKSQQTPILTIWRTLYFERHRMGEPVYTEGTYPSKFAKGTAVIAENDPKVLIVGVKFDPIRQGWGAVAKCGYAAVA